MNRTFTCAYCKRDRQTAFRHDCIRHPVPCHAAGHPKGQHRGALYVQTPSTLSPGIVKLHSIVMSRLKVYEMAEDDYTHHVRQEEARLNSPWYGNQDGKLPSQPPTFDDFPWRMLCADADADALNFVKAILRQADGLEDELKKVERVVKRMEENPTLTEARFVGVKCPTPGCEEPVDFMVGREATEEGEVDLSKPELVAVFAGQNCTHRIADWQLDALGKDAIELFKNPPQPAQKPVEKEEEGDHAW